MSLYRYFLLLFFCLYVVFSGANASHTISSSEPMRNSETVFSSGKRFKLGFFSPGNSANRYVVFSGVNASDTISSSEPVRDSETIISSGNRFNLGFFSPGNSANRYAGIMFNLPSPTPTVVWVANRDKPLHDSSGILTISEDGNLVILNGQKEIIWSSSISNSMNNSTAQLLDTGNLVLKDRSNGRVLWESFQYPTDSLLQFMKLGIDKSTNTMAILKSWKSPDDPSVGNFSAGIQNRYIPQFLIWKNSSPYWRSGPWNKQIYIGLPEMNSYYFFGIDLVVDNAGTAYQTYSDQNQSRILYYSLNSTGSYQEKIWDPSKKNWWVTWENHRSECDVYAKCGPFGSCNPGRSPICSCIQGFKPKNEGEWEKGSWTGGCIRRTALNCERNRTDVENGKQDGFLKLQTKGVPDFAIWVPSARGDCEGDCLSNCSCTAYSYYTGIGCMHWNRILIDIREYSMDGAADLFIRVAYSELENGKKAIPVAAIASTVSIGSITVILCGYLFRKLLAKHRERKNKNEAFLREASPKLYQEGMIKDDINRVKIEDITLYSFDMLANATDKFHLASKLGQGGFGPVYKGKLPDGQEIAVKRLSQSSGQGLQEFMNEVVVISRLQHRNLVRLLGCCTERGEKMLVYDFMPNRSLDAYLFGSCKEKFLDWSKRAIIIEGTGRGLLYLHRDSRLRIIHRDLKASNILLDEYLNPKISDFGMARIFGGSQDQANTIRVVGTYGYMAPEYAMQGRFSERSDVYSFGVLILEIVSGRKNSSFYGDGLTLLAYAWKLWNENNSLKLIDPKIFGSRFEIEMVRCVHIGLLCVQEYAEDRPNVSTVLSMLTSDIAELPTPKQPAFTGGHASPQQGSSKSQGSMNADSITVLEPR
ncbi:G-type lectin S-receptor-like serine/threonine-protein kinase At1g11300 isoform X2 [Capsicum annuum]|uniref:G-type lectin S-receptor-like serine/threonine-protein kinase At1g11300 isoform X2 n=1 Tax=Capsicum annuum TaxID=4072 RepID=UPI0007BF16E9|nr:G-type lectin S-receptor-like serine/threonine-protein kinase At1g11300 isoform X2 [Capsicum annuum]